MCSNTKHTRRAGRAFSLAELIIVIAIMGILATTVTVSVRGYLVKARQNTAKTTISNIVSALETFYGEYSRFPTNEEGLRILTKPSSRFPEALLKGDDAPIDPWGNPYQYISAGPNDFEVFSLGADGNEGGTGGDADISSKDLAGGDTP